MNPKTITISIICIAIGIVLDYSSPRKSVHALNQYHSSAFHSSNFQDPIKPPDPEQTSLIPSPKFTFYINTPPTSERILLEFRYQCQPSCGQIWLSQDSFPGDIPPKFLIRHPIFENLPWFSVWNNHFFLYQKELKYKTIDEFLQNPPQELTLTEQSIAQALNLNASNIAFLEETNQIGDAAYILSTFQHPRTIHDWSKFTYRFNVRGATRDPQGNLPFTLHTISQDSNYQITITKPHVTH